MAIAVFAAAVPALAEEAHQHKDEQCAKECDMLLKDCAQEVDSINDRIRKLQNEINVKGASTYTLEELKVLNKKLKESNELLRTLEKPR